jgi:hypothetical protein
LGKGQIRKKSGLARTERPVRKSGYDLSVRISEQGLPILKLTKWVVIFPFKLFYSLSVAETLRQILIIWGNLYNDL